jgi:hypothetical protein
MRRDFSSANSVGLLLKFTITIELIIPGKAQAPQQKQHISHRHAAVGHLYLRGLQPATR